MQIPTVAIQSYSGAGGFMEDSGKYLVLRDEQKRFFRDWLRDSRTHEVSFRWVIHLSCARGFPIVDKLLAESFQRFLHQHGHKTEICEVEKNRLLKIYSPQLHWKYFTRKVN